MTTWQMSVACWIPKATDTHSEYVILIVFPLQQCFHERSSILCHTYVTCLVQFSACDSFSDALSCVVCPTDVPHCCSSFLCFIVRNILGLICLMIVMDCCCEMSDENVGFLKKMGNFWLAEKLLASHEGLSFMDLVTPDYISCNIFTLFWGRGGTCGSQ